MLDVLHWANVSILTPFSPPPLPIPYLHLMPPNYSHILVWCSTQGKFSKKEGASTIGGTRHGSKHKDEAEGQHEETRENEARTAEHCLSLPCHFKMIERYIWWKGWFVVCRLSFVFRQHCLCGGKANYGMLEVLEACYFVVLKTIPRSTIRRRTCALHIG